MRRWIVVPSIAFLAVFAFLGIRAFAAVEGSGPGPKEGSSPGPEATPPPEITLKGEVISLVCYVDSEIKGESNRACSLGVIRSGQSAALLTDDGKVVVLLPKGLGEKADFSEHVARQVEAKGVRVERGGIAGLKVASLAPLTPPAPPEPKKRRETGGEGSRPREGSH